MALKEFKNKYKIDVLFIGIWLRDAGVIGASPDGLATISNENIASKSNIHLNITIKI